MEHLDGLMKLVENELDSVLKNGKFRSREEIDSVYKLVDIVKDSMEIGCMEDEMYEGGSSYGNRRGSYDYGSYGRNNRSMGRYSRDSYRGGSYGRGYSRGDDYRENLMEAMENAPDEQTRQSIQRMLDSMK